MNLLYKTRVLVKRNSPLILAVSAAGGVVATSYLTGVASYKAAVILENTHPKPKTLKEKVRLVWRNYIPAAGAGALTTGAVFGSFKISQNRTAANAAAYSAATATLSAYREKVAELLGPTKEKEIKDDVAAAQVAKNPPSDSIVITGSDFLCCELHTGRYFNSDMQTLRKAQNDINAQLLSDMTANLDDFYYLVGLKQTSNSNDFGWTSDKQLELEFSSILTPDGRPCLAIDYNYVKPLYGYRCAGV